MYGYTGTPCGNSEVELGRNVVCGPGRGLFQLDPAQRVDGLVYFHRVGQCRLSQSSPR